MWVLVLRFPLTKCVTFGKILDLSGTVSTNSKMKAWVSGKLRFLSVIKFH